MTTAPSLEQLAPSLFATTQRDPLPFMEHVELRSFVLDTDDGPIIIYNTPGIDAAAEHIPALGTPRRLLMNHWHEGMHGTRDLDVPASVHERDRKPTERSMRIDETFTGRRRLSDDLEIIPSLAHTAGASFFLWDSGEHRYLFPGDSIWVEDGVWRAVILGESSRPAFLETLAVMHDLDFDVLVPWTIQEGQPALNFVAPDEKDQQLEALRARIVNGVAGPNV